MECDQVRGMMLDVVAKLMRTAPRVRESSQMVCCYAVERFEKRYQPGIRDLRACLGGVGTVWSAQLHRETTNA